MMLGYLIYPSVIVIATGALSLGISQANAVVPTATDIRIGSHADKTRFVIDISDDIKFKIFTLSDPYRVVIDLPEIGWRLPGNVMARTTGVIDKFRYGLFRTGLSRVVLDVKKPVKIKAVFMFTVLKVSRVKIALGLTGQFS